jgi:Kdo2-lipid IVA lauroyltransferase/acyltransferase
MKSFLNLVAAAIFISFLILISVLPFFLLFLFAELIFVLLFWIVRYRRKVMVANLGTTFPEKSAPEIRRLLHKSYANLVDIIVEGIKSFTLSRRQVLKRHRTLNPELAREYLDKGTSVIIVTGHYNNWEWGSLSASAAIPHPVVAFYKPLSNRVVDTFIRWNRSRFGTVLASIGDTAHTFEKYHNKGVVFLMAADQNPSKTQNCHWIRFLGRDTVFLYGPEKYARKYGLPLIYADVQRVRRGTYTVELSLLTSHANDLAEGETTLLYARKLESVILGRPENWLWSHRRWKHKLPAGHPVIG